MNKKIIIILVVVFFLVLIVYFFKYAKNYPWKTDLKYKTDYFGVTFSTRASKDLGLDWRENYLAMLDDLKVKEVRLPVYWDEIEIKEGQFDFTDYDFMINEGANRDVKFIIAVGARLPRWPECHYPTWVNSYNQSEIGNKTIKAVETIVSRYRDNQAVEFWQVENEPLLNVFGICPKGDINLLKREVAAVKELDSRPIIISASGELSSWKKESMIADSFGTTIYRVVWNSQFGYLRYPIPSWFYSLKAGLAGIKPANRFILELQAEPWSPTGQLRDSLPSETDKSFDLGQFKANAQYAINIDFSRAYLWGVEWWYYQKSIGNSSYWEFAQKLFK